MRELPDSRDRRLGSVERLNKLETMDRYSESDVETNSITSMDKEERLEEKRLPLYTLSEVSDHGSPNDCWIIVRDRIYDVTRFLKVHPGGDEIIMENAGTDATFSFRGVGHSKAALEEMEKYCVGVLIESERLNLDVWRSTSILSTLSIT